MAKASPKNGSNKAGAVRSSLTGRFVMAPATNGGRITIAQARNAAKTVQSEKR